MRGKVFKVYYFKRVPNNELAAEHVVIIYSKTYYDIFSI